MTGLRYAIIAGLCGGTGLWLVLAWFMPARPKLAQALAMLSPFTDSVRTTEPPHGWEVVGAWGLDKLPEWVRPIPAKNLALLSITPSAFLARKIGFAIGGLLAPGVVAVVAALVGMPLPWVVPAVTAVALAGAGFMLPDLDVRGKAARARRDFSRTLACFVDLVALERSCGSGTKQALDTAAGVGDSWAFRRLRECLDHSTWAGVAGWDAMSELAAELDLPELSDVADIIRISGSEGAGIYRILRARARGIREALLTSDLTRSNEANERMSLPVSVLGIIFLAILIGPALLSMTGLLP